MNDVLKLMCGECEEVALVREPYGDFCAGCWLKMKDTKPKCRKDNHLYTGYYGERVHTAKLTAEDVFLIKELLKEGLTLRNIAEKFDVTQNTIWTISKGKNWNHVA